MTEPKPINLALQGGGAHGAFTWGVLDQLLQDGRLDIRAISGASAGAMNAVICADGILDAGLEGARRQLEQFWSEVGREGALSPVQRTLFDKLIGSWSVDQSPSLAWFGTWSHYLSPYDLNPLNLNPLRDVLDRAVNFARLRKSAGMRLFVSATHVQTGRLTLFETATLTADRVMASACLPHLFQAVMVDGEAYWDGGYSGNPALFPLLEAGLAPDTLLVQINPQHVEAVPESARAIANRLSEITLNASLESELRMLSALKDNPMRLHRIGVETIKAELSSASRLNAEWAFLVFLRDQGRKAAAAFLAEHFEAIGKASTFHPQRRPR